MNNELNLWPNPNHLNSTPNQEGYEKLPDDFDPDKQLSIETGYFVFTMMPSLRCSLNCPHCYLTKEQRRSSDIMTIEQLKAACIKVDDYYSERSDISRKVIVFYWYGGEPTEMGLEYFLACFNIISEIFKEDKGYYVRHDILTSLLNIEHKWFDVFRTWGRGHFQTSFDGLMRGKGYVKKWEKKVKEAVSEGLSVSTISVVNNELISDRPEDVLDYLVDLKVTEASFLPFMLNDQNSASSYEKFAPPMTEYSDFMIKLTNHWLKLKKSNVAVPEIGQMNYVISRQGLPGRSNIAAQTLFLLPNGDFVLPDYREGYLEFMRSFGNIFKSSFESILSSRSRREYIRKQYLRNRNEECVQCEHKDYCIMEFWKENRDGDDCFGAQKYIKYLRNLNDEMTFSPNKKINF